MFWWKHGHLGAKRNKEAKKNKKAKACVSPSTLGNSPKQHTCHDQSLGPRRDMANEEPEGTPNKPLKLVITLHRSRKYIQH
ncbi:hypothetical protein MTR67_043846 [Solanum verrucosum]|uniref:Uncharacterized protein n=1 Tax=Solanum verrucosum TaxID=315347 RepID=A0AAF0ZT22_SOLVR|nr:hypothetical protein MTR67_043846 [Solanum verrucosum]